MEWKTKYSWLTSEVGMPTTHFSSNAEKQQRPAISRRALLF
jgi:hypothetical protein